MYNVKNVKNTHTRVLLLVKFGLLPCNFFKSKTPPWVFFAFFKLCKCYQIAQNIKYMLFLMLGGILFYYRTLICVHFLLFSKCWFFMVFIAGVLISIFLPVSLCLNHWGKWDTARHDGIVPLPWKQ